MNPSELERLRAAAEYIQKEIKAEPKVGIVLGSGLYSSLEMEDERCLPFAEVPHFPRSTVPGHAGELCAGRFAGRDVLAQKGRVHYYEGYAMREVAFPVWVMKLLGIEQLFITNAAGAINEEFSPGDLVLIKDHINMIPDNPLRGENLEEFGPRFPNLLDAYSPRLREVAIRAALEEGIELKEGVYVATPGPMYETPAEIEAYRRLGADLVGMSTVPEVIASAHCGLEVLAISCVTNMAAGIGHAKLTHEEVLEVTAKRGRDLIRLIRAILREM
jgi:purine-nucleoside phosphorylase